MIGMNFGSFLTLLIISLIAALVVHYAIHHRFLAGVEGFLAKWIVGWVGGWVASPVLGHWFTGVTIGEVYVIPAIIGAFVGVFVPTAMWKARAIAPAPRLVEIHNTQQAA